MSAKNKFLAALLALAVPVTGVVRADEDGEKPRRDDGDIRPFTMRLPEGFAGGQFWIGAMCVPADAALRAQLNLKDHEGLVVANILPESPAAKAGLQQFDVVTAIDGESLDGLHELMQAVHNGGEKELKLDVIRGGKRQTIAVKPAPRPDADRVFFRVPRGAGEKEPVDLGPTKDHLERMQKHLDELRDRLPEAEVKRMEEWLEKTRRGENEPFRMQVFGPGVVMRQPLAPALPAGVNVRIEREANGPTKIHVERGDEKWDVTDKELDQLPEDLRGPIGAVLNPPGALVIGTPGGGAATAIAGGTGGTGKMQVEIRTDEGDRRAIVVGPQGLDGAQQQLRGEVEQLRKQVEALQGQLQKQMDDLRKLQEKAGALKPPKKDAAAKKDQA
ncbi:MAG: hypothetical protein C0483_07845 [Pirellula sp.]|nr:hypothetical protein [Pirellula sp.]